MIGETLGHYRITEKIGAGGMGVVYRARDEHLGRDVAVKLLPAGTLADEAARKRFCKEALALSKLNHPNIETVHDFDSQHGVDFLVMELILGVTLDEKLTTGALPEKEVARLGTQMAEGLAAAHDRGVLHCDLKPGNLRVTLDGRLKILDFGLAKLLRPAAEEATRESLTESLVEPPAVAGTLPYMPPEQLRAEKVDFRTDIYALGAVLYEMATGQRAFPDTQGPRLIDAILHSMPVPPRAVNAKISPRLEEIILKCMEKEPENRYQSARELAVDLRRLAMPSAAAVALVRGSQARWRYAGVVASIAVVLVAVLVGWNVGGWRQHLFGRPSAGDIHSLAVLPLANLSGGAEQEYFADGMTEALIADLAQIGLPKVISRTSVMRYKKTDKSIPDIARELKVDAVIEGSVVRAGDRVRITAQLIHGPTDRHLWAQNYERDLRDILALQSEVARAIANEIKIKLTPEQEARLASVRPVNPEAHELYLKGSPYCRQPGQQFKGVELLRKAIELDPGYAPAYASLASCYNNMAFLGLLPPSEGFGQAKELLLRARELDESLVQIHRALAFYYLHREWNWAEAEREYKRALELNPNDGEVHHVYAHFLMAMGRSDEAVAETLRAAELDPVNLALSACRGWHCLYARRLDDAVEFLQKTLAENPNHIQALAWLGQVYEQKGKYEEASGAFEKAVSLSGGNSTILAGLGHAYAVAGRRREAEKVLSELKSRLKRTYVSAYDIATVYAGLRDKEQSFLWLEKAYQERSALLVHVKWDPRFNRLRSDPRFTDLLRHIGLPHS